MCSTARSALPLLIAVALVVLPSTYANGATYTVTVSVQGLPPSMSTRLYVDGAPNGTLTGGQTRSFSFPISLANHVITVDFYVPNSAGNGGTRYYDRETSWIFNSGGNHAFTYLAQYYLSTESPYSIATGDGWYDSGSTAQVVLKEGELLTLTFSRNSVPA